jgi:3-oxoacyl-[acyl-carrier protein] reductase
MTDRFVLVTGSSRGIGRAIALRLAKDGFDIVVHCRQQREQAGAVADAVRALGREARVLQFDVADRVSRLSAAAGRHGAHGCLLRRGVQRRHRA